MGPFKDGSSITALTSHAFRSPLPFGPHSHTLKYLRGINAEQCMRMADYLGMQEAKVPEAKLTKDIACVDGFQVGQSISTCLLEYHECVMYN